MKREMIDSADYYTDSLLVNVDRAQYYGSYFDALYLKFDILLKRGMIDKADALRASYKEDMLNYYKSPSIMIAKDLELAGRLLELKVDLESAIDIYLQALNEYNQLEGDKSYLGQAQVNNRIGIAYARKGMVDLALKHLKRSVELYENQITYNDIVVKIKSNLGALYQWQFRYRRALEKYEKSIIAKKRLLHEDDHSFYNTYSTMSVLYERLGEINKSIEYRKKAIRTSDKSVRPEVYIALSNSMRERGEYSEAKEYLNLAQNAISTKFQNNTEVAIMIENAWRAYNTSINTYNQGIDANKRVVQKYNEIYRGKTHFYVDTLNQLAFNYGHQRKRELIKGNLISEFENEKRINGAAQDKSLTIINHHDSGQFENTIKHATNGRIDFSWPEEGRGAREGDSVINSEILSETLFLKAEELKKEYEEKSQPIFAKRALESYRTSSRFMNVVQLESDYVDDLVLSAQRDLANDEAISLLYDLFLRTENQRHINQALVSAEEGANGMIREQVNQSGWKENEVVPMKLIALEQILKEDLSYYEDRLYTLSKSENLDSASLKQFEKRRFEAAERLDSLKVVLFDNFKPYFDIVYGENKVSISELQKHINSETMILQYVHTRQDIYLIKITKTASEFHKISAGNEFNDDFSNYLKMLQNPRSTTPSQLCSASANLFEKLLGPVGKLDKNLILVPDGILGLLPFETLVNLTVTECGKSYGDLPYLLKQVNVRYVSSLSQVLQKKSIEAKKPSYDLMAMAPEYNQPLKERGTIEDSVRAGVGKLVYTKEEINSISDFYKSKTYLNGKATEANFRKSLLESRIIHIASHALIDDNDPLFSRIVFDIDPVDTLNDGNLYVHEIYNLVVGAELVVLSACNTGGGEVKEGEGVMSLGRGFFYAGAKSVVLSQWHLADRSASVLMRYFYENLSNGVNKSEALRQAKLRFLSEVSDIEQHPFFWAAFVSIGDDSPIDSRRNSYWPLLTFIFILTTIIISYWVRRRSHI